MSRRFGILALVGALFLVTGDARAQAPAGMEETVRPATTSIYGDTGLWFVPTGEVLRDGTWSASAYRLNWDVRQGFTDISHFEGTFAYRREGPGGDFRRRPVRHPNRPRHAPDLRVWRRPLRRRRQQLSVRARGMDWQRLRRHVPRRQGQPAVRIAPAPGRPRPPRHGEGADGFGRRRLGHRQDGRAVRLHPQQGNREHRRGLRQHRLPPSRRSGRVRPVERHALRHRRAVPHAQPAEVHDRVVRRDLQQGRRDANGVARAGVGHRRSTAAFRWSRRTFRCSRR